LWALLERLKIGTGRQTNLKEDYILLGRRIGHNTIERESQVLVSLSNKYKKGDEFFPKL
jgi:hypothetical protein